MKKVLSSILAATMLVSSIGALSVFADEPASPPTVVIENVNVPELKSNEAKKSSKKIESFETTKPSEKSFFSKVKDYVASIAKEISEHPIKYALISTGAIVAGYLGYRALAAQAEASRLAAEKAAKLAAAQTEASRLAAEKAAKLVAAQAEASRLAAEKAAKLAAEQAAAPSLTRVLQAQKEEFTQTSNSRNVDWKKQLLENARPLHGGGKHIKLLEETWDPEAHAFRSRIAIGNYECEVPSKDIIEMPTGFSTCGFELSRLVNIADNPEKLPDCFTECQLNHENYIELLKHLYGWIRRNKCTTIWDKDSPNGRPVQRMFKN